MAEHVVPVRLVRKTLRVVADDAAWINEMTYLVDSILERLQDLLPGKWVDKIQTVAGEPIPEEILRRPLLPARLAEITPEMRARAQAAAAQAKTPALAATIERAMLATMRRISAEKEDALLQKSDDNHRDGDEL